METNTTKGKPYEFLSLSESFEVYDRTSINACLNKADINFMPGCTILSIPDTVSVRWYVWGDNSGGSRVSRDT